MANISYGVNLLPKTNNAYTLGNSDYKWSNIYTAQINGTNVSDLGKVQNIQINGNSILNNGVANIPIAGANGQLGVCSTDSYYGIQANSSGRIYISAATSNNVKDGTYGFNPIVPSHQHEATFYGLAKAAGDSTQAASSNTVGTYTANAKTAIQNMLSVAPTTSPVFTGNISLGRYYTTEDPSSQYNKVGTNSIVVGENCIASEESSQAFGAYTYANGVCATAIGTSTLASGIAAFVSGWATTANGSYSHVFGQYNVPDSYNNWPTWTANTSYKIGDKVKRNIYIDENTTEVIGYTCIAANSDSSFNTSHWMNMDSVMNYVEIVGNGDIRTNPSNARVLDWDGNEYLKGYLYVGCNADSTGGIRVPHDIQLNNSSLVSNGVATIPIASDSTFGVIKTREFTDGFKFDSNNNFQLAGPSDAQIKAADTNYRAITPYVQHTSVFYGLAKAAGDTTQSASDNAVGTYTSSAKTAIKTMLDIPTLVSQLTNDSGFLTSVPTMTGATSSTAGASGLVPAPTTGDVDKFLAGDGTYKSGGLPMVILSYGNSTWADFEAAYNNNVIVYCRASSNSNPKTGSQTRMAFMAYVNNETTPTNVEFQYYRSMSSHSGTQMGDQVYVYKLDKTSGWSVTVREAGLKEIAFDASTGLQATWSNNKLTITTV